MVEEFDEKPARKDWLLSPPTTRSTVQIKPGKDSRNAQVMLSNGLVSRTFLVGERQPRLHQLAPQ